MSRRALVLRLLRLLRPLRGVLVLSTLCRLGNHLLGVALLVLAVGGLVHVARGGAAAAAWPWALALAGVGMLKGVLRYAEQFSGHHAAFRLLSDLRHALYEQLERLVPEGVADDRSGDMVSRAVADMERIEVFYAHTIAPVIVAAVVPPVVLGAVAHWSGALALGLLPFVVAVGAVAPWGAHLVGHSAARGVRRHTAELNVHFTDTVQGMPEILAFGGGVERVEGVDRAGRRLDAAQRRLAWSGAFQTVLTELFIGAGVLVATGLAVHEAQAGRLGAWDLPIVAMLAVCAFLPLLGVSHLIPDLEQALGSAERLFAVLDRPVPAAPPPLCTRPRGSAGVTFRDVTFSYPGRDEPALRAVSFAAEPGAVTAFVGPSGAGKSTVLHLLLRLRRPDAGTIRIGGIDVRELGAETARELLAVVPQHVHLFHGTVRDNLLLARPGATRAEIERAAQRARIHDFLAGLPQGYETPVHEAGARLSGGQRQRLGLARAFLREAPVLVLDEATAHLDEENERMIHAALRAWMAEAPRPCTVMVIAHRMACIRDASVIHVLDRGAIVESGTHGDLVARDGVYADLFAAQG